MHNARVPLFPRRAVLDDERRRELREAEERRQEFASDVLRLLAEEAPSAPPWAVHGDVVRPPVAEPVSVEVIRLLDEQVTRAEIERTPYELSIGPDGAKAKGADPWTVFWLAVGGLAAGATIVVTARHVDRMLAASVRGG